MKQSTLVYGLCLLLMMGCHGDRLDTSQVKEEMNAREIIRATPGQITEKARQLGKQTQAQLEAQWRQRLKHALDSLPPEEALAYCRIDDLPVYQQAEARIIRLSPHPLAPRPDSLVTPQALELLEAYVYGAAEGVKLDENIQKTRNDQALLYTKPLMFDEAFCLKCHGQERSEPTTQALRKRFPQADSVAFQASQGDLAGIWSIEFEKRTVVSSIGSN
ncbi:Protein of unknown function [Catalinimonas alkaloidigena]|uniref:Tll0287-like domain-containing protein n=1 Tax=Catalinimonas alkaloidigena TaxID=1075417 RepID=A0A1G9ECH1_9BACT|nr:DUF3365 domain-containing protein [Catalinimonas alkaloidigena]SDK73783.1 Protein of unknown function [Catalinimonas alkaloidigena]